MPDCRESDLISSYIDGELSGREKSAVDLHLAGCRACREELRDLREMKDLIGSAPMVRAPADLTETLIAQAVAARRAADERRRMGFPLWAGGLAAAATLVIWVGVRQPTPETPLSLDTLVAAHHRTVGGSLHDQIRSATAYSTSVKKDASNARV